MEPERCDREGDRRNAPSFSAGTCMAESGAPRSRMPRIISTKCVSGGCLRDPLRRGGMPSNGNMNPDIRIDGRIKERHLERLDLRPRERGDKETQRQRRRNEQRRSQVKLEQTAVDRHIEECRASNVGSRVVCTSPMRT